MPEMDQSRLTTEELAFLQALDDQAREFQENATAFARQLGEDFAECLRIIRRLAGGKPPADSIRIWTCDTCGASVLHRLDRPHVASFGSCYGTVTERVYVPAGTEPDREAMVQQVRAVLDAAPMAGECTCPPDDNSRCDACKDLWADAIVTNLYPSKP